MSPTFRARIVTVFWRISTDRTGCSCIILVWLHSSRCACSAIAISFSIPPSASATTACRPTAVCGATIWRTRRASPLLPFCLHISLRLAWHHILDKQSEPFTFACSTPSTSKANDAWHISAYHCITITCSETMATLLGSLATIASPYIFAPTTTIIIHPHLLVSHRPQINIDILPLWISHITRRSQCT